MQNVQGFYSVTYKYNFIELLLSIYNFMYVA